MATVASALVNKHVVVIGNGVAGSQLAAALAKTNKYSITMVTPFKYQEVSLQMSRTLATGTGDIDKAIFENVCEDNVEYKIASCVELKQGTLTLSDGQTVNFDACVVCTGQQIPIYMPNPQLEASVDARKASIASVHDSISRANSIVIVGGGPLGCETAGDIKLRFPQKKIILVHSRSAVLDTMSPAFPPLATKALEKMGVELHLNERFVKFENGAVTLKSGVSIPCDYCIQSHPTGGNGSFLPPGSVTETGYAKVDNQLVVEGLQGVFALGDISSYPGPKVYAGIEDRMPTILSNLQAYLQGQPLKTHVKGMAGGFTGPGIVAIGHGVDGAYGVGPDMPGCCGTLCWCCCFCNTAPCSTPAGPGVAKFKYEFNQTVIPKKGMGMHR